MEIGQLFRLYRESSRHLFNVAFKPIIDEVYEGSFEGFNSAWDVIDRFEEVNRGLFDNLILKTLNVPGELGRENPLLRVVPTSPSVPIAIENPKGDNNKYWDYPLEWIEPDDITLHFMEFFDFNGLEYREWKYIRAYIADCRKDPIVAGREALCEFSYYDIQSASNPQARERTASR